MKKAYVSALLVFAGFGMTSLSSCDVDCIQGSGHQVTETRKVVDFKKIDISGAFKVYLKQDSSLTVTITADDNIIKHIKTPVKGDELYIKNKRGACNAGETVVTIGVRNLDEISTSGSNEVYSNGTLVTKDLAIGMSGDSKITLNLNAANVTTEGSGSSEIYLTGQASSHKIDFSGDGKLSAFNFIVGDYDIETSGSSDCEVNVLHNLHVSTSGSSDIKYKGNPSNVTNDKSGSSDLEKVN
jgi:hypothetical protein